MMELPKVTHETAVLADIKGCDFALFPPTQAEVATWLRLKKGIITGVLPAGKDGKTFAGYFLRGKILAAGPHLNDWQAANEWAIYAALERLTL